MYDNSNTNDKNREVEVYYNRFDIVCCDKMLSQGKMWLFLLFSV